MKKMVKSGGGENFIFLMFSLFVQHFCFLDKAANSLIRHRTLIPCLGGTKCLSVHPCLSECLWHVTWPKSWRVGVYIA